MADGTNDPTQPAAPVTDPPITDPAPAPDPAPVAPDPTPTPAEPAPDAPAPVPDTSPPPPAPGPVTVDNRTKRDDNDTIAGHWLDVIDGPYAGRFGAYVSTATHGEDGYPDEIVVRTRDALNELIIVPYAATRPSERTGGR